MKLSASQRVVIGAVQIVSDAYGAGTICNVQYRREVRRWTEDLSDDCTHGPYELCHCIIEYFIDHRLSEYRVTSDCGLVALVEVDEAIPRDPNSMSSQMVEKIDVRRRHKDDPSGEMIVWSVEAELNFRRRAIEQIESRLRPSGQ